MFISPVQANQPTPAERAELRKRFDLFDKNKDGHITCGELKEVLDKVGHRPTDAEIDEFVRVCDTDKNGTIEFNEFCKYLIHLRRTVRNSVAALQVAKALLILEAASYVTF